MSHYTLASSPLFDPPPLTLPTTSLSHVSPHVSTSAHAAHAQDPLLDNSNLCDILMLERALESEAVMGGGTLTSTLGHVAGENRVDMLEIPGKGRCYVYLARYHCSHCLSYLMNI